MQGRQWTEISIWFMREPSRDPGRLADILDAANNVATFIDGIEYDTFVTDKMRYFAVLKNIEIIGEASYMLSQEFKDAHSDIPWDQITKMRHVLVHDYSTVLPNIIWETALTEVPALKEQIKQLLGA